MSAPVIGQCDVCGQHDLPLGYDTAVWACPACEKTTAAHLARRAASLEVTPLGVVSANSATLVEHKIRPLVGRKSAPVLDRPAPAVGDSGSFTGYLAVIGNRDHQGDTIQPGALDATAAEFTAGRQRWLITDSHSDYGADVVAEVKHAVVDSHGLRVEAVWMPTARAQELRGMVNAGAGLGLSIDYLAQRSRPDGGGGRLLDAVAVVGAAITPKPANPLALIIEGKHAGDGFVRVVTVAQEAAEDHARRERESPQRRAEDALLAASWAPAHLPREIRLALIRGAAEAKARRELAEGDPARARAQAKQDKDNAYSFGLRETMARLAAAKCPHPGCMPGRCAYAR